MKLLIIEDDIKLCETLEYQFIQENFEVTLCHDGSTGLKTIANQQFDIILLDRMLPFLNGIDLLKEVRSQHIYTPIILLTALGETHDKILGLNSGADDYIVKPFEFEELLARINCVIRRFQPVTTEQPLSFGDITLNYNDKLLIQANGEKVSLSTRENDLFRFFLQNANQTLPRETIIEKVWGLHTEIEDGNLDNYIHFLRRRLKSIHTYLSLTTVRGIGYRLEHKNV